MVPKGVLDKMICHPKNHQKMENKKGRTKMGTEKVTRKEPKIVMKL